MISIVVHDEMMCVVISGYVPKKNNYSSVSSVYGVYLYAVAIWKCAFKLFTLW